MRRSSSRDRVNHSEEMSSAADDETFNRLAGDIAGQISGIQANARQIQSLALGIGTQRDNASLRQQLHALSHNTKSLCQTAADGLRVQLTPLCAGLASGIRRVQKDKLVDQLAKAAGDFQEAQRLVQSRERDVIAKQRQAASGLEAAFNSGGGGTVAGDYPEEANPFHFPSAQQQQQQQQAPSRQDLQAVEERESQLHQLEQDIVGINEMFKDLAQMVHEQGDMLDSIEDHVGQAVMQVEEGSKNLKQAVVYQKSARRKKIILAVIIVVVILVVAGIIAISVVLTKK